MDKKLAIIVIGVVLVITGLHIYSMRSLKFDYNFENFFPIGDKDLIYYQSFREKFENDNDYLLLGFKRDAGVFNQKFLKNLKSFREALIKNQSVLEIQGPTNLFQPIKSPGGIFKIPVIHVDQPSLYPKDSIKIYNEGKFVGTFFSKEGNAVAMVLKHTALIEKPEADSLVYSIDSLSAVYQLTPLFMAGKAKAQGVYIDKMQIELVLFLSISMVLVVTFLSLAYRSLMQVIVPLVVVVLSVIWILGIMGLFDKPLDIMLVLLPSIMFVVAMSDVVHILTKYIEELRIGRDKIAALKTTMKEVGLATFLTSITTAIGFLTLYTASIKPIREFGLYTAVGVFVAFILAFSLLPAILLLTKTPSVVKKDNFREKWLQFLSSSFVVVLRNAKFIGLGAIIVVVMSIVGINKIIINTYLLEDIPNDDPLKEEFTFFDEEFGGSRPLEVAITVIDSTKNIFDLAVLQEIEKVENYLVKSFEAGNLASPTFAAKSLNQTINGGLNSYFRLPEGRVEIRNFNKNLRFLKASNSRQKLFADNYKLSRFSGKIKDIGSKISLERNEDFDAFVRANIDSSLVSFQMTGTSLLIDKNNQYLTKNMMEGLGIAFLVIAIIVAVLFRSFKMILIALVPNVIPLMIVAALMGYFGISLKLSTSIIFTIAFGIAVDDTIHFISKLKLELDKGKSILYALKRTYLSTGKAIIITTAILAGGFLTLILSTFGGTFYTGLLVSLTLVLAVFVDLTLLPALLVLFFKKNKTKT